MAEYIEREAAYEKCGWYNTVNGKSVYAVRKDELAAIPAADVEPVRHGRWESKSVLVGCMKFDYFYECTACRRRGTNYKTNYCPNCGAKMDLEVSV